MTVLQRVFRLFHARFCERGSDGAALLPFLLLTLVVVLQYYFGVGLIRVFTYHSGVERSLEFQLGKADLLAIEFHLAKQNQFR